MNKWSNNKQICWLMDVTDEAMGASETLYFIDGEGNHGVLAKTP